MEENFLQQTIICPSCGEKIPINEAISKNVEEKIRKELNGKYIAAIQNEKKKIKDTLDKENQSKIEQLQKILDEKNKILNEVDKKEETIKKKEEDLSLKELKLEQEISKKIESEKKKIEEKIRSDNDLEMKDLKNQIDEQSRAITQAKQNELELRKQKRDLEEKSKSIDLEIERQVEERKTKIHSDLQKELEDKFQMKNREYEELINRYKRQVEELNHKLEQGSQQLQGEVQELELEELLKSTFPIDKITPVAKGKTGADILQEIVNQYGQNCGMIIWESKRTKNWSDNWINKLKDDQRQAKADIAIIVSQVLPNEIAHLGQSEGVWITDFQSSIGLAIALRENLIKISQIKNSQVGKSQKMEAIYSYIHSNEFKQRIEAIVESFRSMEEDLLKEKSYFEKSWAKKEKQIATVVKNTSGMYGDLQALIGSSLPEVKLLELPQTDEELKFEDVN